MATPQQAQHPSHLRPPLTLELPSPAAGGGPGSLGPITGGSLQGEVTRRPGTATGPMGEGISDLDDGLKSSRAQEPYVRPAQLGQPLPPAKGSALLGRGVTKMKEIVRVIRKSMLAVEESVPWELVQDSWETRRSAWRKALKYLDAGTGAAAAASAHARTGPTEGLVVAVACAILELHEALLTDKSPATGGLFARGSTWESRLYELAEGATNYLCLMAVWDEMHEAVRRWLASQGKPISQSDLHRDPKLDSTPPLPGSAASPAANPVPAGKQIPGLSVLASNASIPTADPSADGAVKGEGPAGGAGDASGEWTRQQAAVQQLLLQHQGNPSSLSFLGLGPVEAPLLLAGMENLDRGMYNSVLRAFRALEASAVEGEHALSQVAVDRILGSGRQPFAALKAMLAQEEAAVASALEHLTSGEPDLSSFMRISSEELAKMGEQEIARRLLATPSLRNAPTRGVESEPDTDEDGEGATDMDDSD